MNVERPVDLPQPQEESINSSKPTRYGTLSVFELQPPRPFDTDLTVREGVTFRRVNQAEAAAMQAVMENAGVYEPNDAVRRLEAGREGYVAELHQPGQAAPLMVSYGWVALTSEPLGNTGCAFDPPPGDAYLYDFATRPDHRGQGYYPALLRYIVTELSRRGLRQAWIGTEPGNEVSARSIVRAGFTKIADTRYVPPREGYRAHFELVKVPGSALDLFELARQSHVGS